MSTNVYNNYLIVTIILTLFWTINCSFNTSDDIKNDVNALPSWPWKSDEYPNPKTDWKLCNNISDLLNICDTDRLLTREQILNLNQLLLSIENMTKCDNCFDESNSCQTFNKTGLSIGIALAKQIFYEKSSYDENSFADDIRNKWQLSQCDNDLIFFIASEKHKMLVSVGTTSKHVFEYTFEKILQELEIIFEKSSKTNYYEFLMNATKLYANSYVNRLKLLSLSHDLSAKDQKNFQNSNQKSNVWLPWNARQPFSTILGIGYCLIITSLLMIACYYCCGKKFNSKTSQRTNSSSVSSEQTTKYSELRLNSTEKHENIENDKL